MDSRGAQGRGQARGRLYKGARCGVRGAHAEAQRRHWPDITTAHGLYVFCLATSRTVVYPYYVGRAGVQTLYKRAFQKKDKPAVYGQIMREFKTAKPLVYLLPLVVEDEEGTFVCFAKSGQRMQAIVNMAEESLIAMALHVNDELWNVQHSRALDRYSIDGTRTSWSTDTNAAKRFRAMLHQGRNSAKATRKIKPDVEVAAASIEAAGLVGAEASPMLPARAKGA